MLFRSSQSTASDSSSPTEEEQVVSIRSVLECFSLGSWSCEELCKAVAQYCDADGLISHANFDLLTIHLATKRSESGSFSIESFRHIIDRTFDVFSNADDNEDDDDKDGIAYVDLVTAFTVFCSGSLTEKAAAAFAFFDDNSSGSISFDSLVHYLSCLFKLLYDVRTVSSTLALDSADLANIVALDIFRSEGLLRDERLSFDQFDEQFARLIGASVSLGTESERFVAFYLEALMSISVSELLPSLAEATDADGFVSQHSFDDVIASALQSPRFEGCVSLVEIKVCNALVFAAMGEGVRSKIDFSDLVGGLVTLCGTFASSNAELLVSLLDVDSSGRVSKTQVGSTLSTMLSTYFTVNPHTAAMPDMVEMIVSSIFDNLAHLFADDDYIDSKALVALLTWVLTFVYDDSMGFQVHDLIRFIPQSVAMQDELSSTKALANFGALSKMELFEFFASAADDQGSVEEDCLTESFEVMAAIDNPLSGEELVQLQRFARSVHALLAHEQEHASYFDVACALTVFVAGSDEENVQIMFDLLDSKSNGRLNFESVVQLLQVRLALIHFLLHPDHDKTAIHEMALDYAQSRVEDVYDKLDKDQGDRKSVV